MEIVDTEWRECGRDLALILLLENLNHLVLLFYLDKMGKGCYLTSESSGERDRGYRVTSFSILTK